MGSGQSARKLTIENEEIENVLRISESVAERLTQKANESHVVNEVRSNALADSNPKTVIYPQVSQSGDISAGYPMYHPQITLSALQIQQQKEQELRKQDNYWQNRLHNLEKKHSHINDIINTEYKKAVDQLYTDGKKGINIQDIEPPCKDNTQKVLQCYQDHPKEILKCSTLVEEFSSCVDQRRTRVIEARC